MSQAINVAIRVDASARLGIGHLMRCLTLAGELRTRQAQVLFLSRALPAALAERIAALGCHYLALDSEQAGPDDAPWTIPDWAADARLCQERLSDVGQLDWLVVDHYGLDRRWEEEMSVRADQVLVIDDLANRQHTCDMLLDQNLFAQPAERYVPWVNADCRMLLGPSYALLRSEFRAQRRELATPDGVPIRVLLSFGGSDPSGETVKVLEAAQQAQFKDLRFDVVVGSANVMASRIQVLCASLPSARYLFDVQNMAVQMRQADIFLGAGGTTTWERCCVGLPGTVVATADNQIAGAQAMARRGAQLYLGLADTLTGHHMLEAVAMLVRVPELRHAFVEAGQALVDGRGTERVAALLAAPRVRLRTANQADSRCIFDWRNAPQVRQFSHGQAPITWQSHEVWYAATLNDPARVLLVGELDGAGCGVLRFDIAGSTAVISIYLAPGYGGRGVGSSLLREGQRWLLQHRPEVTQLEAEVRPENKASVALFRRSGFVLEHLIFRKAQEHVS